IEYRDLRNVVMTSLLTAQNDPQRGRPMQASASALKVLHDSLKHDGEFIVAHTGIADGETLSRDRKSTRLNSSHVKISYAVFCLIPDPPRPTLFPYTTLFRSISSIETSVTS